MVKAFGKYDTTTVLAEDVTPGVLYDLLREIEVHSVYLVEEVEEFWRLACGRQTDQTRQMIESIFAEAKRRFGDLDDATRKSVLANMRKFVKWYDFMVQAAFLDDALMYKKREFIGLLVKHLDTGGGEGFSLKDKVDAIGFTQKKTGETNRPQIVSDPSVSVPSPGVGEGEDEEERLSTIIAHLNSLYGMNFDAGIVSKSVQQIKTRMMSAESLENAAKAHSLNAFKLPFYEAAEDAMTDCLEQNSEFYSLLLNNKDAAETVLGAIVKNVYKSLKEKGT
jgi:type I restriction enzyme R subunit